MVVVFYADSGSVEIAGTEYNAEVTEISVGGGDRDFSTVYTFGDSFEDFDRQAPFETTITTVKQDNDLGKYVMGGAADTTWPISYSGDTTTRIAPTIKYKFYENSDSSGEGMMLVFSGAYGIGISKSIDAEGYLTEEVNFKCLAKNYSEHYTGDVAASGFP
jgi:hypothetical protein